MKGRAKEIKVTVAGGGVPLRLAVSVSVGAISLVLIIFLILFIFWKRKYPAYTQIERGEDGAGKYCLSFFPLYFDLILNNRNNRNNSPLNLNHIFEVGTGFGKTYILCQTGCNFKIVGFLCFKTCYGRVFEVHFVLEIRLKRYF